MVNREAERLEAERELQAAETTRERERQEAETARKRERQEAGTARERERQEAETNRERERRAAARERHRYEREAFEAAHRREIELLEVRSRLKVQDGEEEHQEEGDVIDEEGLGRRFNNRTKATPAKLDVPKFDNKQIRTVAKYLDLFEGVVKQNGYEKEVWPLALRTAVAGTKLETIAAIGG